MRRYKYVWGNDSLEDYFLDVLKYPADTHVYHCGPEYDFGIIHNNQSEYRKYHDDPEFLRTLEKVTQMCESDPDIKQRMILIVGDHGNDVYNDQAESLSKRRTDLRDRFGEIINVWNFFLWHSFGNFVKHHDIKHNHIPNKLFVCLQNRPHAHRISAAKALIDTRLVDRGTCSWCIASRDRFDALAENFSSRNLDVHKIISKNIHRFRNPEADNLSTGPIHNYKDYLFDIVSESANNVNFFTEKTFRPIFFGKPFVILGSPGQNKLLSDQGYETFDEFFDLTSESDLYMSEFQYPYCEATTKHYTKIIKPLCDISDSDIPKIFHDTRAKVKHNHSVMVSQVFNPNLPDVVIDPVLNDVSKYRISVTPNLIDAFQTWLSNHEYFSQFVPR